MSAPSDPARLARQWVLRAEEDLKTAEYLLAIHEDWAVAATRKAREAIRRQLPREALED